MVSGDQTAIFDDVAQVNFLITEFDRMLGIPLCIQVYSERWIHTAIGSGYNT